MSVHMRVQYPHLHLSIVIPSTEGPALNDASLFASGADLKWIRAGKAASLFYKQRVFSPAVALHTCKVRV